MLYYLCMKRYIQSLTPIHYIKGIILLIPFFFFVYATLQYIAFFGTLSLTYNFNTDSGPVEQFEPRGRAIDPERNLGNTKTYQRIVAGPVYMPVTVPRSYDSVDVTMKYRNPDQRLVEYGIVTNEEPFTFRLQPFESKLISEALLQWDVVTNEEGVTLLQKEKQFESVEEFQENVPTDKRIAFYNFDFEPEYIDPNYQPQSGTLSIDRILRGTHELLTYIKDEDLVFNITMRDINRLVGPDEMRVQILNPDGVLIHEEIQEDDGVEDDSFTVSEPHTFNISLSDLEEGVYTIKLPVSTDVVTEQFETEQHKLVVKNNLYIINSPEYDAQLPGIATDPTTLFAQARRVRFVTEHASGAQGIRFGEDEFPLVEPFSPYIWDAENREEAEQLQQLTLSENDVHMVIDGFASFTQDSFFDPNYRIEKIDDQTLLEDVDFILYSDYTPPLQSNGVTTQTTTLTFEGVAGERKELLFMLNLPGIEQEKNTIQVEEVQFDFTRPSVWQKIRNKIGL